MSVAESLTDLIKLSVVIKREYPSLSVGTRSINGTQEIHVQGVVQATPDVSLLIDERIHHVGEWDQLDAHIREGRKPDSPPLSEDDGA